MDPRLKQRLVGAAVLVALAVIFLPMLVKGPAPDSGVSDLRLRVPDAPGDGFKTVDLPLVVPGPAPAGDVLPAPEAGEGSDVLPTVDTASVASEAGNAGDGRGSERLPPTTAGGDYAVHYASFASADEAAAMLRQLQAAGFSGYTEPFDFNGRPAHRVRLGPYATRAEAESVRVRAAGLRQDVSPRVVALDADAAAPPGPNPAGPATAAAAKAVQPQAQAKPQTRQEPASPGPAKAEPARQAAGTRNVAAADVGFVVQLGAFSKAADATALRDRLRAQGIVAFTDTVDTDRGRLTRVKAGPVASRAEAERLKARIKDKVGIDGMVRQHP